MRVASSSIHTGPVIHRAFSSSTASRYGEYEGQPKKEWVDLPRVRPLNGSKPDFGPQANPRTSAQRIEYTDKTARFPPAIAEKRYAMLRENRALGIGPHTMPKRIHKYTQDIPATLEIDHKERVAFQSQGGISNERRAFFESNVEAEQGEEIMDSHWRDIESAETIPLMEPGRVVECRR